MSEFPPLKTHQFYAACRKILGKETLQKIFKRSPTQIYRWAMDPDFCDDWERNPLDRLNVLLERLIEIGREDIARAAVAILAKTVDCELSCIEPSYPDKKPVAEKLVDDHSVLVALHQAVLDGRPLDEVRHLWQKAKSEIAETFELYKMNQDHDRHQA